MKCFVFLLLALIFACSCKPDNPFIGPDKIPTRYISIDGQRFVDVYGRQVILHGINVINKDPDTGYLGHVTAEDFRLFKRWGFNVVRLGIIWDGLEPVPGKYNEDYLKGIDEMIGWAAENDIYVFLDMHQDLFGAKYSDGAPDWATLDEGLPHYTGDIWSDSYLISPGVQKCFDSFWANAKTTTGKGVQNHYFELWRFLANRYKDNTTILGFDIMNEPFMGTEANRVLSLLLRAFANILVEKTGQAPPGEQELLNMWSNLKKRTKTLDQISEKEIYRSVIDAIYDVNTAFEKGTLTTFFQKARDVIREVNKNHIIIIEHNYFSNMGATGALQPILQKNGSPDPLVAYGAHGYDLVVDTDAIASGSNDRVELIFERIAQTGKRLNVPVLIGEWGALPNDNPNLIPIARFLMNQFNRHLFSDTYWAYGHHITNAPYLEVLSKPYPALISGHLTGYSYDILNRNFSCNWSQDPSINQPSLIFIPNIEILDLENIKLSPQTNSWNLHKVENANYGFLEIETTKDKISRTLSFSLNYIK